MFLGACIVAAMSSVPSEPGTQTPPDKEKAKRVNLVHADSLFHDINVNYEAQILVKRRRQVEFEHDGITLVCDSALFYQSSNRFDAFGHVLMNQGDTFTLSADTLYYNGNYRLARARAGEPDNVVLTHVKTVLYCDSLDYDRNAELAYFFGPRGGRMVDRDNELTSYDGSYSPVTRQAEFTNDVRLSNPRSSMETDILHYNTRSALAHVIGPSDIYNDETNHIYTEDGYYDTQADTALLLPGLQRSWVTNGEGRTIIGDTLRYARDGRVSRGNGHVRYEDTFNRNIFLGNYALYSDSLGYSEAADSAVCIDYSQRDTFYIHADTFKLFTYNIDTDSAWREIRAYNRVSAFRRDVQAVCDSLVYISRDSCMTMYKDPILWQNGQQLLGEEIKAWNNDSTIDSTYVLRQALSVERIDSLCYNQVTGNRMRSFFRNGKMYYTHVDGNVVLNYYPYDSDSLLIGMLHAESTDLKLFMSSEQKLERIWMPAAEGTLHPLALVPKKERFLSAFQWFEYCRPKDKDDIFNWRPKAEGTGLKIQTQKHPPRKGSGSNTPLPASDKGLRAAPLKR